MRKSESSAAAVKRERLAGEQAARFARLALAAIGREYPSHISHVLASDADARPPRALTPLFWGSFDWHSAVHGHWCLARLARLFPEAPESAQAKEALEAGFTAANVAGEVAYLRAPGREGFERPYGLAWLLQLCAELREWEDARARRWVQALEPLEKLAADRLGEGFARMPWPDRSGQHAQSAFAMGLAWDWASVAGDERLRRGLAECALRFYGADVEAPIHCEPSGYDFLSPALAEADLMRRVLPRADFTRWFARFLPDLESERARRWLAPVTSPDPADGKLSHLDGLNLSRAWMQEGIASALARGVLRAAAERNRERGLAAVTGEHYAGAHWLASFAVYLETERGIGAEAAG